MPETKINIAMNGKEYIQYLDSRKIKLSPKFKKALPYFMLAFLGSIFLIVSVAILMDNNDNYLFKAWYQATPYMAHMTWDGLARMIIIYCAPYIVASICIGWILHGVGFFIFRG